MFALPCGPFGRWVGVFLQIASCNVTLYIFVFKKKKKKIQKVSHSLLPVTFSRVFLSFNMVIPLGLNFHTSFKISYFKQNLFWHLNNFCNRIFKQPFSRLACKSSSWMFFLGREKAKTKPEMRCDYGFNLFAVCKKCFVSNFRLLKQNVDLYGGGGGLNWENLNHQVQLNNLSKEPWSRGQLTSGTIEPDVTRTLWANREFAFNPKPRPVSRKLSSHRLGTRCSILFE